jgi:hypothetical protein
MGKSCTNAIKHFIESLLRSFHTEHSSCLTAPFFALTGAMCMRRRLRNIMFSSHMTELAIQSDVSHYEVSTILSQLLHSLETAVVYAKSELVSFHERLLCDGVLLGVSATPWHDFKGPGSLTSAGREIRHWRKTLHILLHRYAPSVALFLADVCSGYTRGNEHCHTHC